MVRPQARDLRSLGLLSLLVSIIYVGPTIAYRLELGIDYHGISLPIGYDQTHYTTFIREIYDGNYGLNNGYLFEETHGPRANPKFLSTMHVQFLPILVCGELGRILDLRLDDLDLLLKAVFPPLIFLSLVLLSSALGMSVPLAISAGLFAVFLPQIWTGVLFFLPGWQPHASHLVFMRPVVSQLGFFLFVVTLYLLMRGFLEERSKFIFIGGVFLGVLHYVYFYYWTYASAVLFLVCVIGFVTRNAFLKWWSLGALVTSIVVGLWAIIQYIAIHQQGVFEPDQFMALRGDRIPYVTGFQILVVGFIAGIMVSLREKMIPQMKAILYISLAGAHIVCANAHVVSGLSIEPEHFELFVSSPIFTVLVLSFFNDVGVEKIIGLISRVSMFGRGSRYSINVLLLAFVTVCIGFSWLLVPILQSSTNSSVGSLTRFLGRSLPVAATLLIAITSMIMIFNISNVVDKKRWLILTIFVVGLFAQAAHFERMKDEPWFEKIQGMGSALQWLQDNTPKESVVVAADASAGYICTYTDKDVYISGYGMPAVSSTKEWRRRVFSYLHFLGVKPEELRSMIDNRIPTYVRPVQFLFWGDRILSPKQRVKEFSRGLYYAAVTQAELDSVVTNYAKIGHLDPLQNLLQFKADYILEGVLERITAFSFRRSLDTLNGLQLVYSDGNSKVFKITREHERL